MVKSWFWGRFSLVKFLTMYSALHHSLTHIPLVDKVHIFHTPLSSILHSPPYSTLRIPLSSIFHSPHSTLLHTPLYQTSQLPAFQAVTAFQALCQLEQLMALVKICTIFLKMCGKFAVIGNFIPKIYQLFKL